MKKDCISVQSFFISVCCSHYTTKSELFLPKIQTKNSKNGLGRAKQYFLGYGFALPRLSFRAGGSGRNAREIRDGNTKCKFQNARCLRSSYHGVSKLKGCTLGIRLGHF